MSDVPDQLEHFSFDSATIVQILIQAAMTGDIPERVDLVTRIDTNLGSTALVEQEFLRLEQALNASSPDPSVPEGLTFELLKRARNLWLNIAPDPTDDST